MSKVHGNIWVKLHQITKEKAQKLLTQGFPHSQWGQNGFPVLQQTVPRLDQALAFLPLSDFYFDKYLRLAKGA